MFKVRFLWGKNPKTMGQATTSKDNSKQNIHKGKGIFEEKKNLLRYASVDKYVLLHEGLTSLHFKEKCSCIAAPNELYSVQYPVDK